ncbi:MAG: flagellar basal body P-ring formation protein FlgA [Burkholderiales bacterium]|nr:flagellar basal body P-ring formation protein FlgA [Burkholderiales bacterium]
MSTVRQAQARGGGRVRRLATALGAALAATALAAAAAAPAAHEGDALGAIRLYLEKEATGLPGRTEISVGSLDSRVNLTPCSRVEPFLPPGARPWGRLMVGLRCLDPQDWTAWLPVEVRVFAPALVAAVSLSAGRTPAPGEVRMAEVDLTRERSVLTSLEQLQDRVLTRALPAGQVLRADQFRLRPAVSQGDSVKVVYRGQGFTVSTDARALGEAMSGQTLRVQTGSGKVLTGTVQAGRVVEVRF